jgi:hypothetical protein
VEGSFVVAIFCVDVDCLARMGKEKLSNFTATDCDLNSIERRIKEFVVDIKLSAIIEEYFGSLLVPCTTC